MPAFDHLDELLCHLQCFSKDQRKKDRSDSKPDTMFSFQKTLASHWRVNTYSAITFKKDTVPGFHKSMEKTSVRNLQYGPKTRLIRGMYKISLD